MLENSRDWAVFAVLLLDAVLLAVIELLFLPQRVGDTEFPIVIVLAGFTNPWLVKRADQLGGNGLIPAAPLVVWVTVILVLGTAGPGGDVLLPSNWRSAMLVAAGVFPAAVTLGRALARPIAARKGAGAEEGRHRG